MRILISKIKLALFIHRSGPGIKSLAKKKSVARNGGRNTPTDHNLLDSTPEKVLKRKHVYVSKSKKKQAAPVKQRNPSSASLAVSDFLDSTLWAK